MNKSILNGKSMYLLDGSFMSGITPYVLDIESVMEHPLWGSNLLLKNEDVIINAHKDYIRAGAEFLTTNTYQASIDGFKKHLNLNYEQSYELMKKSVQICRRAIREENSEQVIHIMGSVGPYGAWLRDGSEYSGYYIDNMDHKEIYDWHKPRIQALIEAGVDVILFETIPSVGEANILLNILAEFPDQKACLSFSCKDGLHLGHGETFASAVETIWPSYSQKQLIAIGMNCMNSKLINSLLTSVKVENVNFITCPNGGGEWNVQQGCWDDSEIYEVTVDDLNKWNKIGLKIFGGCCRTDPAKLACYRYLINKLNY